MYRLYIYIHIYIYIYIERAIQKNVFSKKIDFILLGYNNLTDMSIYLSMRSGPDYILSKNLKSRPLLK